MPSRQPTSTRPDATTEFFRELQAHGHEPSLAKVSGTLRFDIVDDGAAASHWLVSLEKGEIAVSRKNARADCVLRTDRATFDGVASGRLNAFAALLREAVSTQGDVGLLVLFQRLFPPPPRSEP
jgi:hypothetical protein